ACAVDTVARKILWQKPVPGAVASPTLGLDGTLYIGTGLGISTFEMATGKAGWEYLASSGGGVDAPIILGDGVVYVATVGSTGAVYAVDMATGTERWKRPLADGVQYSF